MIDRPGWERRAHGVLSNHKYYIEARLAEMTYEFGAMKNGTVYLRKTENGCGFDQFTIYRRMERSDISDFARAICSARKARVILG